MISLDPTVRVMIQPFNGSMAQAFNETVANLTDVILVSGSVTCVLENVVFGLKKNLKNVGNIHVITLPHIVDSCTNLMNLGGIYACHDENSILNRTSIHLNETNMNGWKPLETRQSWYYQQLLKLLAYQTIDLSQNFMIWDADNVLIKKYDPFNGTKTRFGNGGFGVDYSIASTALTGLAEKKDNVVMHQMMINQTVINDLMIHICGEHRKEMCANNIIGQIPGNASTGCGLSEYSLYFTWFATKYPNHTYMDEHIRLKRTSCSNKRMGTAKDLEVLNKTYAENVYMIVIETKSGNVKK